MNPAVNPAAPELSYESRIPSALAAGESVLWERKPIAPEPLRLILSILTSLAIVAGTGIFAHVLAHQTFVSVFCAIVAAVVVGVIGLISLTESLSRRRKQARSVYRITDRRVLRIDDTARGQCDELPIVDLACIETVHHQRGASARFYGMIANDSRPSVEFGGVDAPQQIESLIISQWAAAQRRLHVRRTQPTAEPMTIGSTEADVALHPNEVILWSGRPRPWGATAELRRRRIVTAAWMIVPLIILAAAIGLLRPFVDTMPADVRERRIG